MPTPSGCGVSFNEAAIICMGMRPTHPELLDYLANRFVEGGWRWKPVHREILLSATYQQASQSPAR